MKMSFCSHCPYFKGAHHEVSGKTHWFKQCEYCNKPVREVKNKECIVKIEGFYRDWFDVHKI